MPASLRVLIVGAGIGGNALAFWLSKLRHTVTVVERHPELRVNGLQLDLRGSGIEVMKRMGLEQTVRAKCVPEEGFALVDRAGRRRAYFPADRSGKGGAQSVTSEFEIMRADLCRISHDAAVEGGAKYHFGVSVETVQDLGRVVDVKLTDGREQRFDLVVGCDGMASKVRRLMLAGGSVDGTAKDSALTTLSERFAYFTARQPIQEGEQYIANMYNMPEKRFMLLRRHTADQIQVYLRAETGSGSGQLGRVRRGDVKAEKEAFADLFQGAGWRTDEAVQALKEAADDFYCQYTGFVKMDRWSRGRVTLVGDAGYACPPDGFGTSVALLGSYVLAGEVSSSCRSGKKSASTTTGNDHTEASENDDDDNDDNDDDGVLAALNAYEDRFQPYIRQIQQRYSAEPSWFDRIPSTPFTVSLINNAASVAAFLRLDRVLARFGPAESVKGWDLPAYEEMVRD